MNEPPFLATYVLSHGLRPEPIATAALTHVLRRSAAARKAFAAWLITLAPGIPSELRWESEVRDASDAGVPDLVGFDHEAPRVVLEGKFDANFTSAQVDSTYLSRLSPGQPGLYVVLAPADRLQLLFAELDAAHPQLDALSPVAPGDSSRLLPDGRTLAVISWQELIERLLSAVIDAEERADLIQLGGLVTWYARNSWLPLSSDDLDQRTGRQLTEIVGLVQSTVAPLNKAGYVVTNGSSDYGPGRNLRSAKGLSAWYGVWLAEWSNIGLTPLWFEVKPQLSVTYEALVAALAPLRTPGPGVVRGLSGGVSVPLVIPRGAERGEAFSYLSSQLHLLMAAADGLVKPLPVV